MGKNTSINLFLIQDLPLVSSSLVVMMTIVPNQWEDPGPEEASASRRLVPPKGLPHWMEKHGQQKCLV